MPPFDPQATGFSAKNALLLARLANAAYGTREEAEIAVTQLGFSDFHWIDLTKQFRNVYAIGASCDKFAVVAFRGTKNTKDWMTDLYATPVRFPWIFENGPSAGNIHAGFGHVDELLKQILAWALPAIAGHGKDVESYISARAQMIADGAIAIASDRLAGNIDDDGVKFAFNEIAQSEKSSILALEVTAQLTAQDAINAALSVAGKAINKAIGMAIL
jgi:hypothetical protein